MRDSRLWKAAWPILLCAASAGVTLACVRMSDSNREKHMGMITIEHVYAETEKPFGEVAAAFEARLGQFDPAAHEQLQSGADAEPVRARLDAMAGPSGFMLFGTQNHGALLRLARQQRKAVQYVVGNPLFALQMTQHDIRASLYAPLRVLIYENEERKTCVEYDRPSSLFGQFGDDRITPTAAMLDRKLEALVAASFE